MKIVPVSALVMLAAGLTITNSAAQDATNQSEPKTLSGTIFNGNEDQLTSPGVPIDVPKQGSEISFEPVRLELKENEKKVALLTSEIDALDENSSDYDKRYEALKSQIRESEKKIKELRDFLAYFDD